MTQPKTQEEFRQMVATLESELAHALREFEPVRPPTVRYRLNVKDSVAGIRTTDLTVEVSGEHVSFQQFATLQVEAQDWVDHEYPPPPLKAAKGEGATP